MIPPTGTRPLIDGDPKRIGNWALLGRLGAGGMGVVYLAERPGGPPAALKVIHPGFAQDPAFIARFRREVAASRSVHGRYVAPLIDADVDVATPWLATTYVPGPTLGEFVDHAGPLPPDQLRALAAGLVEGLHSVHAAGVTHRDLKPSNVLITEDAPVIIDFGVATAADATALTGTGGVVGSAGWMSPEQVLGNPAGSATDVHAWGALVAYAATGRTPFGAGRPEALAYRVVHDEPDLDGVPDDLVPILRRTLDKEPARRPSVEDLRVALGGGTVAGTATAAAAWAAPTGVLTELGAPHESASTQRINGRTIAFVAAVVLILATTAGLLVVWSQREDGQTATAAGRDTTTSTTATTSTTTTSTAPTTTTTAAPTLLAAISADYRNFTHAVDCGEGAIPVTLVDGRAELGNTALGDSYIEFDDVTPNDVDGDGDDEAVVTLTCFSGANLTQTQLLTYQAAPDRPARMGSSVFGDLPIIDNGQLIVHEPVYGPDDPRCCPSSWRRDTYEWGADPRDFILATSEPISEDELPPSPYE